MPNEGRKINIMWTGGLDSTYRIVELSRCRCSIQPYYIILRKGKSLQHELNAIVNISQIIKSDKRTQAELFDPIIVSEQEIPRDAITFDSWYRLMKGRSWQYYVLAKYANMHHLEMEMGLQFSPNGSVANVVDETLLIPHPDSNYNVLIFDKSRTDQDTMNVFGNFCFPTSLYHKTKREEVVILRREGYGNIVNHVCFCLHPIWGYPCGHCAPCVSYEKEGMTLPRIGKLLYAIVSFFKKKNNRRVLKFNYEYTIRQVSDVFVAEAKDPETGEAKKIFRLNETGVVILKALQDGADIEEVAKRLMDGYDVNYETAKSHASEFIAKLNM